MPINIKLVFTTRLRQQTVAKGEKKGPLEKSKLASVVTCSGRLEWRRSSAGQFPSTLVEGWGDRRKRSWAFVQSDSTWRIGGRAFFFAINFWTGKFGSSFGL